MDLKKAVLPWQRKSWRKRQSSTMRIKNLAKLAAGTHRGHMAKHVPREQVPALICDSNIIKKLSTWKDCLGELTSLNNDNVDFCTRSRPSHRKAFEPSGPTFLSFLGVESNDCNFCVRNCANMKPHALCCSKQDSIQAIWFAGDLFDSFSYYPPPGLASSFPHDQNFSIRASLSWPLQKLCQHIFHQVTTPPRSSPLVPIDAFIRIYVNVQTGLGMEGVFHM